MCFLFFFFFSPPKNIQFLEPILTDALSMLSSSTSCGRIVYEEKCIGTNKHLPLGLMSKKSVAALSQFNSRTVVPHRLPLLGTLFLPPEGLDFQGRAPRLLLILPLRIAEWNLLS